MDDKKLTYSVKEVAELLGLSRNATYQAVWHGDIANIRLGKRLLIPRVAIEAMLTVNGNSRRAKG